MSPAVWVGIALFILANALYVAAEFGAVGVQRSRVRRLAEDGNRWAAQLLPYVQDPAALDRYVGASQIGITLSSLILGAFAQATVAVALAPVLASTFGLETATAVSAAAIAVLVVLTAIQVLFGELVPKLLALQYPTATALITVLPMRWSLAIYRPFLTFLNGSANALLRLFGIQATTHRHIHSPDEIELLIAESRDGGLLEPEELDRLRKALRLRFRTARELMVPRDRLMMLSTDTPWPDAIRVVMESPFSRMPVYRGTPEQIVGTVLLKDVLHRFATGSTAVAVERLVRPMLRLPATLPADQVIARLREARTHQAVVTDEAGRALGLITVQDVLNAFLHPAPRPSSPGFGAAGRREVAT